jgi:aminoglycoside phosphotransferase (APT) family kinase protein
MVAGKMHADELDTDVALVSRLLAAQFPQWAGLPIAPFVSGGSTNAIYRLGDDMSVRLPLRPAAHQLEQLEKEHHWLPRLAPLLPLAIPVPLAKGSPGEGYPLHWSVHRWLEGETATVERADLSHAARALAEFVTALQRIDPAGGPLPGAHNSRRGVPLAARDDATRTALEALRGMIDVPAATEAWDAALRAPEWRQPPVWIHGDLLPGNLLLAGDRVSAVIDFGCLAVGDPACDLLPAWSLLSLETREVFRAALDVDDATWARGRGWALSVALIQLPYYHLTNRTLAAIARHTIAAVLAADAA